MERYVVYNINTLDMIGMIDPDITSREDHLTRCGDLNGVTTNTITISSDSDIVYPHMITISNGEATYDPTAEQEPDSVPEGGWATFAE